MYRRDRAAVRARAKINLVLCVQGKRPDGYHDLDGVMVTVPLRDDIVLFPDPPDGRWKVTGGPPGLPRGEDNHMIMAARVFSSAVSRPRGLWVQVVKRIPVGAGLGGGSADAAAVLRGLNAFYQAGLSDKELSGMGALVGSDVPFCVFGGVARAGGRGERIQVLPVTMPPCRAVILTPHVRLSTAAVFSAVTPDSYGGEERAEAMAKALLRGDLAGVAANLYNGMTPAAAALCPEIPRCIVALKEAGAMGVSLSGSGPSVFGLFPTGARLPAERLRRGNWEVFECVFTV